MSKRVFWIFGILQSLSLALIIFLIFRSLNLIAAKDLIGLDAMVILSVAFPLFLLLTEYVIYEKVCDNKLE